MNLPDSPPPSNEVENSISKLDLNFQKILILDSKQPPAYSSQQANFNPKLVSPTIITTNVDSVTDLKLETLIYLPPVESMSVNVFEISLNNRSTISSFLMYVPIQVESYSSNALVDTVASISCISPNLKEVLIRHTLYNIYNHTLHQPVKLALAVSSAINLNKVLAGRFYIFVESAVCNYFFVVPNYVKH